MIHFLDAINDADPIANPEPSASSGSLSVIHQPFFWALITIVALIALVLSLYYLSKKGLFVALLPGMAVNVMPRQSGLMVTSRSGRLVLSLPYVAFVSYGGMYGIEIHSLSHSTITYHSTSAAIVIPLSEINPSEPNPNLAHPTPHRPDPVILRNSIAYHHNHLEHLEHLEFWRAQAKFGAIASPSADSLVEEDSPFAFSAPSSPALN